MTALAETPNSTKQCYRCDKPVRMSLPEFHADSQTWTTCKICRDTLAIEAKEIGPIAALRAKEAKNNLPACTESPSPAVAEQSAQVQCGAL